MSHACLAVLLAAAGLSACALPPKTHLFARASRIKPAPAVATASASVDDRLYADAAHAIDVRDYGVALDLLQAAQNRNAGDIRVLNAFGVVYDKLGRFDLSARFYAQAQAIDPNSAIVRENLAYSAQLQGKLKSPTTTLAPTQAPAAPTISGGLIRVAPGVVRLPDNAFQSAAVRQSPGATGHPLALVNASGRRGMADPVRSLLARRGWTVAPTAEQTPVVRLQTEIDYAEAARPAAEALARTLPYKVALNPCQDACTGVRLVLGADAAAWSHDWRGVRTGEG